MARPRRGTKPRRLEHPETARWLLYPDGSQYESAVGSPGPDAVELESYTNAWNRYTLALDTQLRAERMEKLLAAEAAERRHQALEDVRLTLQSPAKQVQARLSEVPQHYALWWRKLGIWLDRNPPKTYGAEVSEAEIRIDAYDIFLKFQAETEAQQPRPGRPKGTKASQETKDKTRATRSRMEAEGTWRHRGPAFKTLFKPKSYEELAREAAGNDS